MSERNQKNQQKKNLPGLSFLQLESLKEMDSESVPKAPPSPYISSYVLNVY